ncbi:MAG: hypothetical protein ABI540_03415 [Spartobacteria bacterium]
MHGGGGGDLTLQSAFSEKSHGAAGEFDIDLPLSSNVGIEDRQGNDEIYLIFNNNVT